MQDDFFLCGVSALCATVARGRRTLVPENDSLELQDSVKGLLRKGNHK